MTARATAASTDAFLDFDGEWSAGFVATLSQERLDAVTVEEDLRRDPTLLRKPMTESERAEQHSVFSAIVQNRGFRNMTRETIARAARQAPHGAPPPRPPPPRAALDAWLLPDTRPIDTGDDAAGGGNDNGGNDETSSDEVAAAAPALHVKRDAATTDSDDDDDDVLYTFESQVAGTPARAAVATGKRVRVPWENAPHPAAAAAAAGCACESEEAHAQLCVARAAVDGAPPGSRVDEIEAVLSTRAPDSRTTGAALCAALARAGAVYVERGYSYAHAQPSHYYLHHVQDALHVVNYVARAAAASDAAAAAHSEEAYDAHTRALDAHEPLVWLSYFYFCTPRPLAQRDTALKRKERADAGEDVQEERACGDP